MLQRINQRDMAIAAHADGSAAQHFTWQLNPFDNMPPCHACASPAGERINCTDLVLLNNGTVALTDVRFNSTGHASDCDVNMNANMSAGANITCNFTQTAALSDFEANQTMYIAASAAGTAPNGSAVFATLGPVDISLPLHQEVTWSFTLLDAPNPVTSVGE